MPKKAIAANSSSPTILFESDPTSLTTTVRIVFLSGSSIEPKGKEGVANLTAELVLRGTKKRSRGAMQSALERMGGAFEATVSHDKIIYSGEVIKENTDRFLKLIHETLTEPAFSQKEFTSLKQEVLAEILHVKNNNSALAGLALRRVLFEGTRLMLPGGGTLSSVAGVGLKDIKAFYKQHFNQANTVIGVASALKEKAINARFEKLVAKLPKGERNPPQNTAPKIPDRPTLVLVDKAGTATGTVFMAQAGITAQEPERFALELGNFSFGGEPLVSRLFKTIRGELGWTYSVASTYSLLGGLSHQKGIYAVVSTPSLEFTTQTIMKSLKMWGEYLASAVDEKEFTLARESVVNSYPFDFESADKRLSKRLYSYVYQVPLLTPADYKKTIESITRAQIQKALKAHHTRMGWWITLVAESAPLKKQLEQDQKDTPADQQRLAIAKQFTPEQLIQ